MTHALITADPGYKEALIVNVTAAITDATTPLITVAPATVSLIEGGPAATYTVSLNRKPATEVTVTATPDAQVLLNGSASAVSHTFTSANWSAPWTVSVKAVVDGPGEGAHTGTVTHGVTTADYGYDQAPPNVTANINDSWRQQAYLKAPNVGADDRFGWAVAVGGDTIVVGAFQEGSNQTTITNGTAASADNSATFAGAAYVFTR